MAINNKIIKNRHFETNEACFAILLETPPEFWIILTLILDRHCSIARGQQDSWYENLKLTNNDIVKIHYPPYNVGKGVDFKSRKPNYNFKQSNQYL